MKNKLKKFWRWLFPSPVKDYKMSRSWHTAWDKFQSDPTIPKKLPYAPNGRLTGKWL